MKLIVGLGNPGNKYHNTRHNFGFMVVDHLAQLEKVAFAPVKKHQGDVAEIRDATHGRVIFLKPQTYMNLSGESVLSVMQFYKIPVEDVLVVVDDLDLPLGKIRFARGGSSGGHNGLKSIITCLGTEAFQRLRLGISRPQEVKKDVVDHVLEKFTVEETGIVRQTLANVEKAVKTYLKDGIEKAMNLYN